MTRSRHGETVEAFRRGVLCGTCAVWLAAFAARASGQASRVNGEVLDLAKAVKAERDALDLTWHRRMGRVAAADAGHASNPPPAVLVLTLARAVADKDLHVALYRTDTAWIRAFAWAPAWNLEVHPVTPTGLDLSGAPAAASLRGGFTVRLLYDGFLPIEGTAEAARFTVNASIADGAVAGTFAQVSLRDESDTRGDPQTPPAAPLLQGKLTGRLRPVPPDAAPPGGLPVMQLGTLNGYDLYAAAVRWEADAAHLYRLIRAADLSLSHSVPYPAAIRETLVFAPVRAEFDAPHVARDKKAEKAKAISIEDLDAGGDEAGGTAEAGPKTGLKPRTVEDPRTVEAVRTLRDIVASLRALRPFVDAADAPRSDEAFLKDTLTTEDPDFGPWYGEEALPCDDRTDQHSIPADAGSGVGPQRWPCVSVWKILGPVPLTQWEWNVPHVPDLLVRTNAIYAVDRDRLRAGPKAGSYKGGSQIGWKKYRAERPFGYMVPDNWAGNNRVSAGCSRAITDRHSGLEYSSFFAYTELVSERDTELWAGIGVTQRGKLWVNDRLCWVGPSRVDETSSQHVFLTKLRFSKGVNRLLFRCDVDYASPSFWVRLCTRGQPREASAVRAHEAAVGKALAAGPRPRVSTYRGDQTGNFPDAEPPVAWDYKRKVNVLWHTPLRYWSNASPVLGGDRLFVAIEPHWLVCLSKADGRILWERPVTAIDLLENEPLRQEGWRLYNEWWQARAARDALPSSLARPDKWLGTSWWWAEGKGIWQAGAGKLDERRGASPEMLALLARKEKLEQAPDPTEVQQELTRVLDDIQKLKTKESANDPDSPAGKTERLHKAQAAWIGFVQENTYATGTDGYWYDYDGHAFATPVTDGKHVWWRNGMEAVACFDMDGNRKWMTRTYSSIAGSPCVPSPILADGKLIVKMIDAGKAMGNPFGDEFKAWRGHSAGTIRLTAYDAATGAVVWETRGLPTYGWNWNANTPALVTLSNGRETMKVLATAGGSIVRVDDGRILVYNVGADSTDASVLPMGDIVIYPRPHLVAVKLIMLDRDTVGFRRLWSHQMGSHGIGYHGCIADRDHGLLYHETGFGHYYYRWPCMTENGPNDGWIYCIVKDLGTGNEVAELDLHRKGGNYWSLSAVTRDCVFMLGGDRIFIGGIRPPMHLTAITRGREPVVLARNVIDRTYGGPVFEQDRMYLRQYTGVTCVGYTGEDGRRHEAEVVARTLLDQIHPEAPADTPPVVPAPGVKPDGNADARAFTARVEHQRVPHSWLFLGPFPASASDDALVAMGGPGAQPRPGAKVAAAGLTREFTGLSRDLAPAGTVPDWEIDRDLSCVAENRRTFAMHKLLAGRTPAVCYLYCILDSPREQVMRLDQTLDATRVWIGGQPVQHGQRVRFNPGQYGLLVELRAQDVPERGILFSPMFRRSDDPRTESGAWAAFVRANRSYLDRVVRLSPASPEAKRAATALASLREQD